MEMMKACVWVVSGERLVPRSGGAGVTQYLFSFPSTPQSSIHDHPSSIPEQ
jgi:quercetin dioxygenase-like cupin family protein